MIKRKRNEKVEVRRDKDDEREGCEQKVKGT